MIGSTEYIPIYRAKVPNDLRIIYQISVEPDTQNEYDRQVIKILRIESRAHVDYQFWVKVSRHWATKGSEYRRRCKHRFLVGDGSRLEALPAKFPAGVYQNIAFPESIEYEDPEFGEGMSDDQEDLADAEFPGKTTALIYKMRAVSQSARFKNGKPVRQLFVTRSRVLAQHVESSFRGLTGSMEIASKTKEELREMAEQARHNSERTLAEFDNEIDLRDDLPTKFSLLQEDHFPLFISFDKLCTLLEGDLPVDGRLGRRKIVQRTKIEFNEFREKYWPQFKRYLTSVVDPALVFSEIVGVIKGSSEALKSDEGYLSRSQYTDCLHRRVLSQLTKPIRDIIYSIFEQYRYLKGQQFELDHADRTREILKYFRSKRPQRLVDFLYVDEVQDNLMMDIFLLRTLCSDIQGTYWGGDTAQTIVAGSAFRIKELKSFVYKDIVRTSFEDTPEPNNHSGIVNCAASIVEIIYRLFPDSIDRMATETARVSGPAPVLFTDPRDNLSFFEGFVLGSSPDSKAGFGAQQAILVRSDATVEELDSKLEGLCPILTITDSKGLEFDDVLIYNFFSHSTASVEDWQFISSPDDQSSKSELAAPPVLCMELKMLYVAMTRARKRCWIWDSGEVANEMKDYLLSRRLITASSSSLMVGRIGGKRNDAFSGEFFLPSILFEVSSTPAQWVEKGQEYFSCGLYKLAAACFRHASREAEAKTASAYHRMTRAKLRHLRFDSDLSRDGIIKAANGMKECAIEATGQNARHFWFHVATCLQLARELVLASDAFIQGGFYVEAVNLLFEHDEFDRGTTVLLAYREQMEPESWDDLLDQFRHHFFQVSDYRSLARVFSRDLEAQLSYACKHGYLSQRKYLLRTHKRFDELIQLYLDEKSFLDCVDCYIAAYHLDGVHSRIDCAVRTTINFGQNILLLEGQAREPSRRGLLDAIALIRPYLGQVGQESQKWVNFIRTLARPGHVALDTAKAWNLGIPSEIAPRILALYFTLTDLVWLQTDSLNLVIRHLYAWDAYAADILRLSKETNRSDSA
ncbi:hypothetical protein FRC10_006609, partial [Ceratobasidium sp. 414]